MQSLVAVSCTVRVPFARRQMSSAAAVGPEHRINTRKLPNRYTEKLSVGQKVYLCRCWQSAKFPYCDGSHAGWNKRTGDDVGPVVVCAEPPSEPTTKDADS